MRFSLSLFMLCFFCSAALLAQGEKHSPALRMASQMPLFPFAAEDCSRPKENCAKAALEAYLLREMKYPATAREAEHEGVAVIAFIVETDGSISEATISEDPGLGLGQEALRLVNAMNEMPTLWTPGVHRKKAARVRASVSVPFSLTAPEAPTVAAEPAEAKGEIFKVVEKMPMFPYDLERCEEEDRLYGNGPVNDDNCATKAMLMFIYGNLQYPAEAENYGTEGMAVVSFVVETDGSISGARTARDPGDGTGEEALRIVNLMNEQGIRWEPGMQGGKNVRVQFNLPIKFKLD